MRARDSVIVLVLTCVSCETARVEPARVDAGLGDRLFAERCRATEDCASGLCLEIGGADRAICTRRCAADGDCPGGTSWGCVQPVGFPHRVCGCEPDGDVEVCGDGVDNECNGAIDDCQICGGEAIPVDDPRHCGACDRPCRVDEECAAGSCRCEVPGQADCEGSCVDPSNDPQHCGGCGHACGPGRACVAGRCQCEPSFPDDCDGQCVDITRDHEHCGGCGNACADAQVCLEGTCSCPSPAFPDHCVDLGCVDLATDETNCGGCGRACRAGEQCVGGRCTCPIAGQVYCDGACRDLSSNPTSCGVCGRVCRAGERCVGGTCRCDSGLVCGDVCVTRDDPVNCGGCGVACRDDQYCSGTCRCVRGVDCGGACVDTANDEAHCGACGRACTPAQVCTSGACRCPVTGETYCDALGACVDLQADEANCGACGLSCPAAQTCSGGRCVCPIAGQTYCAATGTCVDLTSDEFNCGGCGVTCSAATSCVSSVCRCPVAGQTHCPATDSCTSLATDPANCGACGNVCPSGTTCSSWACRCDDPALSLCGAVCVDRASDPSNCGSCGNTCAPGRGCESGGCWCPAPVAGAEVRLTNEAADDLAARFATNGTQVGVVWAQAFEVFFQVLDLDGVPITPRITVRSGYRAWNPDVVWGGTEWAVIWKGPGGIAGYETGYFRRITTDGSLIDSETVINPGGPELYRARLAWSPISGYAVAFGAGYFRGLGLTGTTLSPAVRLPGVSSYMLSRTLAIAAAPDGRFGVHYHGDHFQIANADGTLFGVNRTTETLLGSSVAHDGTSFVVTGVRVRSSSSSDLVLLRGSTLASSFTIASGAVFDRPTLAITGGLASVVWTTRAHSSSLGRLRMARLSLPSGAPAIVSRIVSVVDRDVIGTDGWAEIVHPTASRAVIGWTDARWGQSEVYDLPVDVDGTCL